MVNTDIIIIGGGAAGLMAACAAGDCAAESATGSATGSAVENAAGGHQQLKPNIILLEKNARVGRKLLSTGNGRCNLSHVDINAHYYHSHAVQHVKAVLAACPADETLAFFKKLGLRTTIENGRIYPYSQSSSSVLDVLRIGAECFGVETITNVAVQSVSFDKTTNCFVVKTSGNNRNECSEIYTASKLIVTTGGKAAPSTGSDGAGYAVLARFGHSLAPPYPVLTPLTAKHPALPLLKGVRVKPCRLTLISVDSASVERHGFINTAGFVNTDYFTNSAGFVSTDYFTNNDGFINSDYFTNIVDSTNTISHDVRKLAEETGEILFTEYGLSGIPAMQVSGAVHQQKNVIASLDLLPDMTLREVWEDLYNRRAYLHSAQAPVENLFTGIFHKRVGQSLLKQAGIAVGTGLGQAVQANLGVSDKQLHTLAQLTKAWTFDITGVKGFTFAQATGGGVDLAAFTPSTMQSLLQPGLYAAGEVLDVYGDCGGYNLHWAWVTGLLAGRAAVKALKRDSKSKNERKSNNEHKSNNRHKNNNAHKSNNKHKNNNEHKGNNKHKSKKKSTSENRRG